MSDFRQNFMKSIEQNNSTNLALIERYTEDSANAIESLSREMAELRNVNANLEYLYDEANLRKYFEGLQYRFDSALKKHTLEFAEEVGSTRSILEKKLTTLLQGEGVSSKDIYDCLGRGKTDEHSHLISHAGSLRVQSNLVDNVRLTISKKTEEAIRTTQRKKSVFGVIMPIFLAVLILTLLVVSLITVADIVIDYAEKMTFSQIRSIVVGFFEGKTSDMLTAIIIAIITGVIVYGAIWVVYYKILSKSLGKNMVYKLNMAIPPIIDDFETRKSELKYTYREMLTDFLNESNERYLMKYKPLIDLVV